MNTSTEVPASTPRTVSWSLIDRAIEAVPATRYALGVGGIAAVVSLVAGLKIGLLVSGLGTVIMLGLMVVLLVFANLAAGTNSLKPVALAFAWGAVVLTVFVGFLVVSTTFWGWPRTWRDILASMPVTARVSEQVTQGTLHQTCVRFQRCIGRSRLPACG